MDKKRKPNGYWTLEVCRAEALKYQTRIAFNNGNRGAYRAANYLGIMDDISGHMVELRRENMNERTDAELLEMASKYRRIVDLKESDGSLYIYLRRRGLLKRADFEFGLRGFDPSKPGRLYYLRVDAPGGPLYKIGITNQNVKRRFTRKSDQAIITRLRFWSFKIGAEAQRIEALIKTHARAHRYTGPDVLSTGNTELFSRDILALDT